MIARYKEFGDQLKKCRKSAGITQAKLADYMDKDPSSISYYERGQSLPTRERLDEIVHSLQAFKASEECLVELYRLAGYEKNNAHVLPIVQEINRLIFDLKEETEDWNLLKNIQKVIIDDWRKYIHGLRDLRYGGWQGWLDSQEAFQDLLLILEDEIPIRRRLSVRAYHRLALAYFYTGNPLKALDNINEAIRQAIKMEKQEEAIMPTLFLEKGNIYRRMSEWSDAINNYERSREYYKRIERNLGERQNIGTAIVERKIAGTLLFQGKAKDALEHCKETIRLSKEGSDLNSENKGMQHYAWAISLLGDWEEALKIHKNIVDILKINGSSRIQLMKSQRYLADIYRMCGVYRKAEKAFNDALKNLKNYYKDQADRELFIQGMLLRGKAATYIAQIKDPSSAQKLLDDSLGIHIMLKSKLDEAMTRSELGKLAMILDDFPRAEREINKAKNLFEQVNNQYYSIASLVNLAELEYHRGEYAKARARASTAIYQAENQDYKVHLVRAKLVLADINLKESNEHHPSQLFSSALQTSLGLNNFLVHEVLCRAASKKRLLKDEDSIQIEILRLCKLIAKDWMTSDKSGEELVDSDQLWLNQINQLQKILIRAKEESSHFNGHALIIGIGNYPHMGKLKKSTVDAKDLRDLLISNGYRSNNLALLLNDQASKNTINRELAELARVSNPDDTVIIFFSGHGIQPPGGFYPGEYLCPFEANKDELRTTAFSSKELTDAIKAIPARQVVVLLDACHSGGVGELKDGSTSLKEGLSYETYEQLASVKGRIVIASCEPDEFSWELPGMRNSLFTNYLLNGLRGEAADTDGVVYVLALFKYLSTNVPKHKSQHPFLKAAMNLDFPIIPSKHFTLEAQ